jgi:cysteine desulfurase
MTSSSRLIYLDHAATTAVDPRVLEAMLPYLSNSFGNPSSTHYLGRQALSELKHARSTIANVLEAKPSEIVFTSGGTESDNLALRGAMFAGRGNHIITSAIEHHAVLHTCKQLADLFGVKITYVPVDRFGQVNPDDIGRAIKHDTCLISIMYANNEIGAIQPLEEIGKIAHSKRILFHTDAVQAPCTLSMSVNKLKVDMMSLSGHKIYGPKGIGVLYVRNGVPIKSTQTGGGHEQGLRAGTENMPGIVGFAKALYLVSEHRGPEIKRLTHLRDFLIQRIISSLPQAQLTGHPTCRLANSASFVFPGIQGQDIVRELDQANVMVSSASACTSCNATPSHVLLAMGYGGELSRGNLRLTLGIGNTREDVNSVMGVLPKIISRLSGYTLGIRQQSFKMQVVEPDQQSLFVSSRA